MNWPPPPGLSDPLRYNPVEEVGRRRISAYLAQEPEIGRLFYAIVPVAALVAEGARNAEPEWFNWLNDLAGLEPTAFMRLLRYASRFTTLAEPAIPVSAEQRSVLYRRLGPWGVALAYRYLRDGCTEDQVRQQLVEDSGVQRIENLVVSHFGKRAYLVKLDRILSGIREIITTYDQELRGEADTDARVDLVKNAVEEITDREQGLWAMEVLRLIGHGQLKLAETETSRIVQLVEPGASCALRLGMPENTPPADLVPVADAEVSYWRKQNNDVISFDSETREVIRLLLRAAEDIKSRVIRAEELLRQSELLREQSHSLLRGA